MIGCSESISRRNQVQTGRSCFIRSHSSASVWRLPRAPSAWALTTPSRSVKMIKFNIARYLKSLKFIVVGPFDWRH